MSSPYRNYGLVALTSTLAATLSACGAGFSGDGTTSTTTTQGGTMTLTTTSDTVGDGDGDSADAPTDTDTDTGNDTANDGDAAVDILFVVDNSGSMGATQAKLAASIDGLVAPLEAASVDYRIGVTTSDNGNPWCPAGTTTPEGGKFVLSPCTSRIGDFLFNNGDIDAQDIACNDVCTLSAGELQIQPTTTDYDGNPAPRPWVENIGGQTNLPPGTDVADALRCFLPQGINGCGFESQLESMYLGLVRAENNQESNYGFMRPAANLAVVFVTDEADCSYNKNYAEIFEQDGNKVFWSDLNASFPTSAVCWNAGVTCTGDPSNYSSCDPVNKDVNGNSNVADGDAVLHPLSRYQGLLDGLEQEKQQLQFDRTLVVALIGGVGSDGVPVYSDVSATDPQFQDSFGIGPGCSAPDPNAPGEPIEAVPPVRMRDIVEGFGPNGLHSVCAADYSPALASVANRIINQL